MPDLKDLIGADKARVIARDEHPISRQNISPNALKVLYRLASAGYYGFLVGGGVRDLLLDNKPKDFDVATDATPEEIKQLFRNARIIGRRFRIVHVRYGREIIEVTTFRAAPDKQLEVSDKSSRKQLQNIDSAQTREGMIVRDNVYGRIDEDAARRDFTINALYYTTDGFKLLDFCDAMADIEDRCIRMIGDATERYREDPVRMLRALRFSAKLGFDIAPETASPIEDLADLLTSISPARLFDEVVKLFSSGHAESTFTLLSESRLREFILGPTFEALECCEPQVYKLVELAMKNTDLRIADEKSVTPYFLFAALLWPPLRLAMKQTGVENMNSNSQFIDVANQTIANQLNLTAIPKRISYASREIWELQNRLTHRTRRTIDATLNHPRFRAAYDFLLLREAAGENLGESGEWWTVYQFGDTTQRDELLEQLPNTRRKRRRKKRPSASTKSD